MNCWLSRPDREEIRIFAKACKEALQDYAIFKQKTNKNYRLNKACAGLCPSEQCEMELDNAKQ